MKIDITCRPFSAIDALPAETVALDDWLPDIPAVATVVNCPKGADCQNEEANAHPGFPSDKRAATGECLSGGIGTCRRYSPETIQNHGERRNAVAGLVGENNAGCLTPPKQIANLSAQLLQRVIELGDNYQESI
jgi:hypothetical protein